MSTNVTVGMACASLALVTAITLERAWNSDYQETPDRYEDLASSLQGGQDEANVTKIPNATHADPWIREQDIHTTSGSASQDIPKSPTVAPAPVMDSQDSARATQSTAPTGEVERDSPDFDVAPIQEPDSSELWASIEDSGPGNSVNADLLTPKVIAASLETQFDSETYASEWATPMEAELNHTFAEAGIEGNQLLGAACRSTLCRIEVAHMNADAETQFLETFATDPRFASNNATGFHFRSVDYNGTLRTLFFWAREGHLLSGIPGQQDSDRDS